MHVCSLPYARKTLKIQCTEKGKVYSISSISKSGFNINTCILLSPTSISYH